MEQALHRFLAMYCRRHRRKRSAEPALQTFTCKRSARLRFSDCVSFVQVQRKGISSIEMKGGSIDLPSSTQTCQATGIGVILGYRSA
jgi:hypothetical protein